MKKKREVLSNIKEEFDKHPAIKFTSVIILLALYFVFATHSHGFKEGLLISILTWSFFVFCTPIADAGILIDFPMRLITGIKMIYSEMIVWGVAALLNLFAFLVKPTIYDSTILLALFKQIVYNPWPYSIIIILSAIGTYLSVYIGDNLMSLKRKTKKHRNFILKHKIVIFLFLVIFVIITYNFLLGKMGVNIPLF